MCRSVLTIAGSDSCGGAGVQADLRTFFAHGLRGASVITAVTAQNRQHVTAVHPCPPELVAAQLEAVLEEEVPGAIKIGMLHSAPLIEAIAPILAELAGVPIILDPVMVATSGAPLLEKAAVEALKRDLFPLAELITPNLREAEVLGERSFGTVLVTGGDGDPCIDTLYFEGSVERFEAPRVPVASAHGTGCTLSSAIAANRALGLDLRASIAGAKRYLTRLLEEGVHFG